MAGKMVTAVIGVGNEFRHDDGAGVAVARRLRRVHLSNVLIIESIREGAALYAAWQGADRAFVIDCVVSGADPGTVFRWDARLEPLPAQWQSRSSTHALGIAEAIELARTLHALPPALVVYGIEGADFSLGIGLTPAVDAAAKEAALRITNEIHGTES